MRPRFRMNASRGACFGILFVGGLFLYGACASGGSGFQFIGSPFRFVGVTGNTNTNGGGGNTNTNSGSGGGVTDPCDEPNARKFVRISMRNLAEDFVHYFLVLVARIDDGTNDGAACEDDIALYTNFGYTRIAAGNFQEFGSICIDGPALVYFHRGGQFRAAGGTQLASAIAPAQGTSPSFDAFFTSAGVQVPVPNDIIFHNPGSGEGASLKISRNILSPCSVITAAGDPICQQDGFYYVDDLDLLAGTTQLGLGSGRRVPAEIQDTGCSCLGLNEPAQQLAPSGATARTAQCNEFLRGGTIQYAFIRNDQNPAIPQLVWRVLDSGGSVVHAFDQRSGVQ